MIRHFLGALALTLSAAWLPAHADEPWPQARPIRIVVPLPPGGPSDIVLRPMAAAMQKTLGQAVIIDNRPGANGNIGSAEVARAAPDGYTWLWTTDTSLTINPHIYRNIGYKPEALQPLDYAARFSQTLVCHPSLGFKTLADMLAAARTRPLDYATGGAGSPGHMVMEMLSAAAKVKMNHVPYRGPAPAMQDLMGGQVQCGFLAGPTVLPQVQSGRLTALAVSGAVRSPLMPAVPTVAESGYPGFDGTFWLVLMAPRGIPPEVQQRFLAALDAAIHAPGQQERATSAGIEMVGSTPAEAQHRTEALSAQWGKVARAIDLQVE
ncbi:MAG TPA: tripartite tricarboxylate transporter substrate binding protein [Variovorax sp.]